MLQPVIEIISEKKLVGYNATMSFSNNRTTELWKKFMPVRKQITTAVNSELYSIEIYPSPTFFTSIDPLLNFQKWAAVEVQDFSNIPGDMERVSIPSGLYAKFTFRGKATNAASFYQQIFEEWLPTSGYALDDRPHFAHMGAGYQNNADDSEETIWIPIKSTANSNQG